MPGGGRGTPFHKWPTIMLLFWILLTASFCTALTYYAIVEPTPLFIRIFLIPFDLAFLFSWLEPLALLEERWRRQRGKRY